MSSLFGNFSDSIFLSDRRVIILEVAFLLVLPSLFFKTVDKLQTISALSTVLAPAILVILVIRGYSGPSYILKNHVELPFIRADVLSGIGIITYAFVCTQTSFMHYTSLKNPNTKNWIISSGLAYLAGAIISAGFGVVGYLTLGDSADGNLLNGYPNDDVYINVVRVFMALNVLCTYPMQFYPARETLFKVLRLENRSGRKPNKKEFLIVTLAMFSLTVCISVLVKDLGFVFEILGNFAFASCGFVLPCILYMLVFWPTRRLIFRNEGFFGLLKTVYCDEITIRDPSFKPLLSENDNSGDLSEHEGSKSHSQEDIPMHLFIDILIVIMLIFGLTLVFVGTTSSIIKIVS